MDAIVTKRTLLADRVAALHKLLRVALDLAAIQDLDRILELVTNGVCDAVECERASLFLYDDDRIELFTRITTELEIAEIRHSADQGIAGWVARHGQLTNVPNPPADPRWNASFDRKTGFTTRNILAVPIMSDVDGRLLGVLQLLNKAGDGFDDFDEQLIQVFAGHAATALERRRLLDEARQSQQFAAAFETARGIQVGLLPQHLPTVPGYRLAALWQPAEFVSGDYYDWLQLPDGRLAIVVGDVSGHGIGAALLMASVRAMLHVLVRTHSTPEAILSLLHEGLVTDLRDSRFITLVMATVDPVTHAVRFANAGHAPALHYRAATDEFVRLQATSLPIGFPQIGLPPVDNQLSLEPGDLLLLGTDGIVEVTNDAGDLFRTERLMDLVRRHHRGGPQHLARMIGETIQDYHGKPLLPDDCTLVVLERQADSLLVP